VSRVIARPFVGTPGAFVRTSRRRDFSLPPTGRTILDAIVEDGGRVHAIGKIEDLFAGRGITAAVHTNDDMDGLTQTVRALKGLDSGLVFTNLVELDQTYGHRSNVSGWAAQAASIDRRLPEVLDACGPQDLVVLTGDHGNDPTTASTDHSREMVPVLVWRPTMRRGIRLGVRATFADVGATVCDVLGVAWTGPGTSMLPLIG
jgi:phosphopentomutase